MDHELDQLPSSDTRPEQPALAPLTVVVEAIYQDGVIKPLTPLDLPPDTPLCLHITTHIMASVRPNMDGDSSALPALAMPPETTLPHWNRMRERLLRARETLAAHAPRVKMIASLRQLDLILVLFGLLVYGLTRFIGLTRFPIYFFSDEAIQATLAEDLLKHGLRDSSGAFLPPYFQNADKWNLSLSIYIHAISVGLFGKSILITRGTSVVVSMLGAIAVTLTLKLIFNNRFWWIGTLVMAALPAWFLHSRTAFETVMMVSFFACFLCTYLLYRYRSTRYLIPALLFGGATFYSYANGQGVMLVSGVLLLLSDLRYHLRLPRKTLPGALLVLALLVVPYVRLHILHPDAVAWHLRTLDSYWLDNTPRSQKLATFGSTYLQGLSPVYWFLPNAADLERHRMKGMGHLPLSLLPLVLIGLVVCLRQWRSSAHRAVLIAVLAAPFSAALVQIFVTRALAMVVPATLLTCIGLDQIDRWTRKWVPSAVLAITSATLLTVFSFTMLRTALVDGPTWSSNYGLYGMQYGAEQVFTAVTEEVAKSPDTHVLVSPSWANNANVYLYFFLDAEQQKRVQIGHISSFLLVKGQLTPDKLFVMAPEEYQQARTSSKLIVSPPERILAYPDGRPGFYFVRMRYVDNVDAIFAAEREARKILQVGKVTIDGQEVQVRYSRLDIGRIADIFDHDTKTLMRGLEANPLVIELTFPQLRSISSLNIAVAKMDFSVKVEVTPPNGAKPLSFTQAWRNIPGEPQVDFPLAGGPYQVSRLRIEITDLNRQQEVHVHVREIALH